MKTKAFILLLLLAMPAYGQEYKAVLSILVKGSDGTLALEREIVIPFVPRTDISIDLCTVDKVTWSTTRQAFVLICRTIIGDKETPAHKVRDVMLVGKWKENFFSPK